MTHAALFRSAVLTLAFAACLPSAVETDAKGALGITTVPSAGARGEPIVTTDGWTVYVEELVVRAQMSGIATIPADNPSGREWSGMSSLGGTALFRATIPQTFVAPGLDAGPGEATLRLASRLLRAPPVEQESAQTPPLDPALASRFNQIAEDFDFTAPSALVPGSWDEGPSVLLIARAEKDGRVLRMNFTFGTPVADVTFPLEIPPSALNSAEVVVTVENLFMGQRDASCDPPRAVGVPSPVEPDVLVFDDFANADADGDGNLSAAELRQVAAPPCACCTPEWKKVLEEEIGRSMASTMVQRSGQLFVRHGATRE